MVKFPLKQALITGRLVWINIGNSHMCSRSVLPSCIINQEERQPDVLSAVVKSSKLDEKTQISSFTESGLGIRGM